MREEREGLVCQVDELTLKVGTGTRPFSACLVEP